MIQQYVASSQVIRIEGETGMQLVEINTQVQRDNAGFNDITTGEFDLVVDETIETASSRTLISQILTDYSHNNPGVIPPDLILEYANIPFTVKKQIQQSYEAMKAQQQQNIEEDRKIELLKIQAKIDVTKPDQTIQKDIDLINASQQPKQDRQQSQQTSQSTELRNLPQ